MAGPWISSAMRHLRRRFDDGRLTSLEDVREALPPSFETERSAGDD